MGARVSAEGEAAEPDSLNLECFADGYVVHFHVRFQDLSSASWSTTPGCCSA